jgi:hypothetical protein
MALSFIKRSDLPVSARGKSAPPSVSVTEAGQITFSGAACEALGGRKVASVIPAYDPETGKVAFYPKGHKATAKQPEDNFIPLRWSKEKNKKGKNNSTSATVSSGTGILKIAGYDYKKSGQQNFQVTVGDGGILSFGLPKGALTPKPKQQRKPRASGKGSVNSGAMAAVGNVPATPQADELVLDVQ